MASPSATTPRSKLARTLRAVRLLSPRQIRTWRRGGYLVLRGFFDADRIDAANRELDDLWATRRTAPTPLVIDVYGEEYSRKYFHDATDEDRQYVYKLDDVYLESELTRSLALDDRLTAILGTLIDGPPMICNSLHFERGSQQDLHFDTYYMPPPPDGRLVVTSICLEDVHPDAGPVVYVKGSHTLPPHIGPRGDRTVVGQSELAVATAYAHANLDVEGNSETFLGRKGDVLIWHEQLFHGGSPIIDRERTRRSLVTHYFRAEEHLAGTMTAFGGGFWLNKPHPKVE